MATMANIWPVYEGMRSAVGEAWARILLSDAVVICDLRREDFLSDLAKTPRMGDASKDLTYAGYQHILVEIEPSDEDAQDWPAGFYHSRLRPKEVFRRLAERALASGLGRRNVVTVKIEPTTDSLGRDALKFTVVITPAASHELVGESFIDALIKLQEQLDRMRVESTPIVEYATESELMHDASD